MWHALDAIGSEIHTGRSRAARHAHSCRDRAVGIMFCARMEGKACRDHNDIKGLWHHNIPRAMVGPWNAVAIPNSLMHLFVLTIPPGTVQHVHFRQFSVSSLRSKHVWWFWCSCCSCCALAVLPLYPPLFAFEGCKQDTVTDTTISARREGSTAKNLGEFGARLFAKGLNLAVSGVICLIYPDMIWYAYNFHIIFI